MNNLGNLWFSTEIDPIVEGEGRPNCFIYGFYNPLARQDVEVLKTRVRKINDPDYWEPSRPILRYGMERLMPMPSAAAARLGRSVTRWNTISKNVVYFDFRSELSAFDKYFYHERVVGGVANQKQRKDFIRKRSKSLKKCIEIGAFNFSLGRVPRIFNNENFTLSAIEVESVSKILGRNYSSIKLIRHGFFDYDAYTCLLEHENANYSEAFAGSGEFAAVRLVVALSRAAEKSLILLDEPEVSLHPGAQQRLVRFLLEQCQNNKHQIILSTHSPAIVRMLPPDAIKVFCHDKLTGKIHLPEQSSSPDVAFHFLGEDIQEKKLIVVEDFLAQQIVKKAIKYLGDAFVDIFDVKYFPGGAKTIWGYYIPVFSAERRSNVIVIFDADEKIDPFFCNPDDFPAANLNFAKDEILRVTKVNVNFNVDGGAAGGNAQQSDVLRRAYIGWCRSNVSFMPGNDTPEQFVWSHMNNINHAEDIDDPCYKSRFRKLTAANLDMAEDEVTSENIQFMQQQCLASIQINNVPAFDDLLSTLRSMVQR